VTAGRDGAALDRGTVRFGTLCVDLAFGHPRYRTAMDTHFRAVVGPPPAPEDHVDLVLSVTDLDEHVSFVVGDDTLAIERRPDDSTRWEAGAGWATLRPLSATAAATADIVLRPEGQRLEVVLHCFAVLVQKVLQHLGVVRLHAAGVVVGGRTAVFVGEKGAGKSTLALGLGRRGATVLGDDQLALRVWPAPAGDGAVEVAGSHDGIRLTAETEGHFFAEPLPIEPVVLAGVAKKEAPLSELVTADPSGPHRPTDLFFPSVGEAFSIRPLSARQALQRLLAPLTPHHRFADAADRLAFLDLLAALVEATDAYEVTLSRDLGDLDLLWAALQA
jgi:hypothetical protein